MQLMHTLAACEALLRTTMSEKSDIHHELRNVHLQERVPSVLILAITHRLDETPIKVLGTTLFKIMTPVT